MRAISLALTGALISACVTSAHADLVIATGHIGNAGNAPDPVYGIGSVAYEYEMGTYEITAAQYTAFLNAVAATDTYGLYNTNMSGAVTGCQIQRSGSPGNYTYSVASDYANRPVNMVSWGDTVRFANWMHNGQPVGAQDLTTTESGSYDINGAMTTADLMAVTRSPGATWVMPNTDEWYKSAYHKNDGLAGDYWYYPTSSDVLPGRDMTEATNPGNNANFNQSGLLLGAPYYRTEVGEFELSTSPYGMYDQAGNVAEWNEALPQLAESRPLRGGSFWYPDYTMWAASTVIDDPAAERMEIGFRLALVPEPSSLGLLSVGLLLIATRRR